MMLALCLVIGRLRAVLLGLRPAVRLWLCLVLLGRRPAKLWSRLVMLRLRAVSAVWPRPAVLGLRAMRPRPAVLWPMPETLRLWAAMLPLRVVMAPRARTMPPSVQSGRVVPARTMVLHPMG
ncbi:hypothetical protein [Nocardia tenerifensis]|uniref:hypothetical protein n=1 Tax=Nocardia tenerifensis TaxID=228006 RepID=UPI0011B566E4|nr:hypothetical protein [Nocardia tenerifensis]